MPKALLLVNPYFPTGAASSSRMLNFGRLLRDAGWSVHVVTGHHVDPLIEIGKVYTIEGITYQVVRKGKPSSINSFIGDFAIIRVVENCIKGSSVDCVFMNAGCELYRGVQALCQKYHCRLYVEQCEWLDLSNYKFGKLDIRYMNTQWLRYKGFRDSAGIVSISRYLDEHYKSIGVRTIRVPTILDVQHTPFTRVPKRNSNRLHIVFAGSLGGSKELMRPIIEALASHERYRQEIVFDIYGPSLNQIKVNIGEDSSLIKNAGRSVVIHGRIPQEQIFDVYARSDYSIFVRPIRRSSNAGFPTKFAESMTVGTPVITNDTGDIGLYLRNGINGFLLKDNSTAAVCDCFNRLIETDREKYTQMRERARLTAEESFDYKVYMDDVSKHFSA